MRLCNISFFATSRPQILLTSYIITFYHHFPLSTKKYISFCAPYIGVGYVNYRDKGMIIKNMKLTGGTLGLLYNIGYDYALSKKWAIGVNLSSIEGTLSSLTLEQDGVRTSQTLDKDNKENLGHIDLSFTLKLNL